MTRQKLNTHRNTNSLTHIAQRRPSRLWAEDSEYRQIGIYQRRWLAGCCIMAGEMEDGGLIRVRVSGLTIGIGLRDRIADGW